MKKIALFTIATILSLGSVLAQGTITFNNRITGVIDVKIFNPDGITGLAGTGFSVQLYSGAAGAAEASLVAAPLIVSTFRTGAAAGYFTSLGDVAVPGRATGLNASIQLRAWDNNGGLITSYDAAVVGGFNAGKSNVFDTANPLGGPGNPPLTAASLAGLQTFNLVVVPEPSVIALGLLGATALLLRRKKA